MATTCTARCRWFHHRSLGRAKSKRPTLAGKAAIDIPEGTQAGKQFRLRGKGIKGVRASYPGDLYCHIVVETPVKLTEYQRKLTRELEESLKKGGSRHSPTGESWTEQAEALFQLSRPGTRNGAPRGLAGAPAWQHMNIHSAYRTYFIVFNVASRTIA